MVLDQRIPCKVIVTGHGALDAAVLGAGAASGPPPLAAWAKALGVHPVDQPVSVVGLTATPFRMEYVGDDPEKGTRDLKAIFHRIVEPAKTLGENPRSTLEEMKILARPAFHTIETTTRIRIPDAVPIQS